MSECFTCSNKISRELSSDEQKIIRKQIEETTGKKFFSVPELEFTCQITGKKISQTDLACENYMGDDFMIDIRKSISDTAKKLRKELTKDK